MTLTPRIPFHFGLFYHAMIGLVGREPDLKQCCDDSCRYRFVYEPRNDTERSTFRMYAMTLAEWLDDFDLKFSGTRCEYGKSRSTDSGEDVLEVTILHRVKEGRT